MARPTGTQAEGVQTSVVLGLCEPSIIASRNRFYLTIRNDIIR